MTYTEKQLAKYRNGNTLLSYFKYQLARRGRSVKYFSRDFLRTYIKEYNESCKRLFGLFTFDERKVKNNEQLCMRGLFQN